ncbi:MAG: hypothetical protein AAF982_00540 [Pseudomonadota bacterium]
MRRRLGGWRNPGAGDRPLSQWFGL